MILVAHLKYDLTGQQFGDLFVQSYNKDTKKWVCKCKCGTIIEADSCNLRKNRTKRCKNCKNRYEDLTNRRFGLLVAKEYLGHQMWLCQCDCGNTHIVKSTNLRAHNVMSCGAKHHRLKLRKEYELKLRSIFYGIRGRCNDYKDCRYGGRGIKCLWNTYEDFEKDMYDSFVEHIEKYGEKETSIDRIDVNGNYCKENCRWLTNKEQANNRRSNDNITYNGETHNITQWAEILGMGVSVLRQRLRKLHWDVDKAFLTPVRHKYNIEGLNLKEYCSKHNLNAQKVYSRIFRGWSIEKAISVK